MSDLIAGGVGDSAVCDVALVISELLSNALRHAGPLPDGQIRVAWRLDPDSVRISVRDGGGPTEPQLGQPTQAATGGRGLRIVEKLSQGWGTSHDDEGSTVWARVPVSRPTQDRTPVGVPAVTTERGLAGRFMQESLRMRSAQLPGAPARGTIGFGSWS